MASAVIDLLAVEAEFTVNQLPTKETPKYYLSDVPLEKSRR